MAAGNSTTRWGWVAQSLHWLMAIGLISNLVIGFIAEDMPLSLDKLKLFLWHKSIGITLLGLILLRIFWRWKQPVPELASMPRWQQQASNASHATLYLLMLALPVSGWIVNSAADFPLKWFGLIELPAIAGANDELKETMATIHEWFAWGLIAVLVVHVLAALKHAFVDKDQILQRMLPGAK